MWQSLFQSPLTTSSLVALLLSTGLTGFFVAKNSIFPEFWGSIAVSLVFLLFYNYIGAMKLEKNIDLLKDITHPKIEKLLRIAILVLLQSLLGLMLTSYLKIEKQKIVVDQAIFGIFQLSISLCYIIWDVLIRLFKGPKKTFYYFIWTDIVILIGSWVIYRASDIEPQQGAKTVFSIFGGPFLFFGAIAASISGHQENFANWCERKETAMPNKQKIVVGLVILTIIASALIYFFNKNEVDSSKHDNLTIGIATWAGFATGMVGNEKHFFQDINLKYRIIDDQPARYAAFQNGNIDIVVASVDEYAQSSQRLKGKIFLITDMSFGGDGIIAKANIKTPGDLKGKKIAFARATPSHYLLYKVLEKNGLSTADIQQIKVDDPGHAADAFLGGSVDAAVTWEPFLSEVKEKGKGHILLTTRDYPGIIVDVLVASEKLSQNPDLLRRFIVGWLRSVDYIKEHPDESLKIMAKGLNAKDSDLQGMMSGLQIADRARNAEFFNSADPSKTKLANMLVEAGEFWKAQGIISQPPPVAELISKAAIDFLNK